MNWFFSQKKQSDEINEIKKQIKCIKCDDCSEINSSTENSCECGCPDNIIIINYDICRCKTFFKGFKYVIQGFVTVKSGAVLSIEDDVEVAFTNSDNPLIDEFTLNINSTTSTLYFESGSSLIAKNIISYSSDSCGNFKEESKNGGWIFAGTNATTNLLLDNYSISNVQSKIQCRDSYFEFCKLYASHLGGSSTFGYSTINLPSITFLSVKDSEFIGKKIISKKSGSDGIYFQNTDISLYEIKSENSTLIGLKLLYSKIVVYEKFTLENKNSLLPLLSISENFPSIDSWISISKNSKLKLESNLPKSLALQGIHIDNCYNKKDDLLHDKKHNDSTHICIDNLCNKIIITGELLL